MICLVLIIVIIIELLNQLRVGRAAHSDLSQLLRSAADLCTNADVSFELLGGPSVAGRGRPGARSAPRCPPPTSFGRCLARDRPTHDATQPLSKRRRRRGGEYRGGSIPLSSRLGDLGERRELPSRVRSKAPVTDAFSALFECHRTL